MYLNSSHNIVNENTLERLNNKQKNKPKKGKKKPDKEDAKAVLEIAEESLEDDPGGQPDKFPALSTYAEDEDLMAVTGPKKNVRKKGTLSTAEKNRAVQNRCR